jgi:S1-C subfamily serine protease
MKLFVLLLAAHIWTEAPPVKERPAAPPQSISALVKTSMPAVVGIVATTARGGENDPFRGFLERMYGTGSGGPSTTPVRGIGTGFFIRADGLIATNGHVVEGATDITVQVGPGSEDERNYRATLIGQDEATDLALLKVEGDKPFPVLPLGDSEHLDVGEWVIAIGNPFGLSRSVTTGIVSYVGRRDVNPAGRPGYYDFIQTDAAINPGNSGGPLLDAHGAVVGINAAVNPAGQGIGFAIPISQLKDVGPQLAAKGRVVRSYLGLSVQDGLSPELAQSFAVPNGKGVVVTEVAPEGPAAAAGLKAGDVLTSFDGEPIEQSYRMRWLTASTPPGKRVKLGLWRSGKPLQVVAVLAEKDDPLQEPVLPPPLPRRDQEPFGLAVEETLSDARGVRISVVDLRGPAYRAGLREGDLILELDGRPVPDKAAWQKALASLGRGNVSRLYVRRGGKAIFFGLRREGTVARAEAR